MSLINEALRKAQNQRHHAPGLNDGTNMGHQSVNYAPQPSRIGLMIGLGICIVILLGLSAGLTVLLLSNDKSQVTAQTAPAEPEATVSETTTQSLTTSSTKELAETAPESWGTTRPETASSRSEPAEPAPEIIEAPVAEPNQEIIDWLDQSIISGVRITSSSSKVILNNKAFIPGDSVNMTLELKILEIEPERIRFIDSNDVEYMKLF